MNYDVLIIGGGPSGLTAGIYAVRAGLSVAIVEKQFAGGQIANTESVENYPALLNVSGFELATKMLEHAEKLGVKIIYDNVVNCKFDNNGKLVELESGNEINAKTVILCAGATPRKLGLQNEDKFVGRGISYCATCDGAFYKDKIVAVVGGGNTAVSDCLYLAKFAKQVHLIHRRDKLRASKADTEKLINSGVNIINKISHIKLQNVENKEINEMQVDGVFVAIGQIPSNICPQIARDEYGYILADEDMKTNIDGVFVAGDVRQKKVRQVVTAVSDGAIAAEMANEYILNNYGN